MDGLRFWVYAVAELTAVAHLVISLVLFYFARRSVRYLSQAWIMLLISLMYMGVLVFVHLRIIESPGILHPGMLLYLLICSFLQSIYPLGISMPGYLQWGRMWRYATPAIVLIGVYMVGMLAGSGFAQVFEASDLVEHFLSGDVLLRLLALALSAYYILNIFILPHRLVRRFSLPKDVITYGTLLGLLAIYYVWLTIDFSRGGYIAYMLLFTAVNLFLSFRCLRPVLDDMELPSIRLVDEPPAEVEILRSAEEDFNAANLRRFEAVEYLMQTEKPFKDSLFNRDKLCRYTGFNRHLLLQTLRSQGYNDIHEYISRYRVAELRRAIEAKEIADLRSIEDFGFKTLSTAQAAFQRYEGEDLSAFVAATSDEQAPS